MKLDSKTSVLQNLQFDEVTKDTGYVFQAHYLYIQY